jgi:hypothetical protein
MRSVFDKITRDSLIGRIKTLSTLSKAEWGKMDVIQMIKHCIAAEEMYLGNKVYPRKFIGKLFGKMALKSLTKDATPMRRNSATASDFKITETGGDIDLEKQKWIALIGQYETYQKTEFEHWFFGKMTKKELGLLVYKHIDHHLRQFNA